jgi:hypothetical protein
MVSSVDRLDRRVSSDNQDGPARLAEIVRARVSLSAVVCARNSTESGNQKGAGWGAKPSSEARQKRHRATTRVCRAGDRNRIGARLRCFSCEREARLNGLGPGRDERGSHRRRSLQ